MTTVKELREAVHMTQKDVAHQMKVAQSTVCMWESGERTPPVDKIVKLAGILNVPVEKLIYIFAGNLNSSESV